MLVGLVGKTNVGKTTFFSAATLVEAERENRPFVTINPNEGVGYVRVESVCTEFGIQCQPKYGWCNGRYRYVPVKLLDVAGLVKGAHKGRGLGNKFLDDLRRASVNIIVVDASGATDDEGNPVPPSTHNPLEDVLMVKEEFALWVSSIIERVGSKIRGRIVAGSSVDAALHEVLSGLDIRRDVIKEVLTDLALERSPLEWSDEQLLSFSREVLRRGKPFVVAANKVDVPEAEGNLKKLREALKEPVVPVSAEAELILRKAAKAGLIRYEPGDDDFEIVDESKLTRAQLRALETIREKVLRKFGSTGVQETLETAVYKVLRMKVVFPVENETKLSDKDGNVLPDAILLPEGGTVKDLAEKIHSEIARKALYGIDVRNRRRISLDHILSHRDVVKIVAAR
ncbi:MAG: redox-regulated ATPase YchF [Candidatus Korarchaeota archaeon]|nr:redox-regulated ATPase YchF [Candidatus Korarchaeota archaeon]